MRNSLMKHTMKLQRYISFFTVLMGVLTVNILSAQIRNPQVEVRRTYEGKIIDANPLSFPLPVHDSLNILRQKVEYNNLATPMETYVLNKIIPPAGIVQHNKTEYKEFFYLRAGLGYPLTPLADLYLHAPLPNSVSLNFYVNHRSFWGNTLLFKDAPLGYTGPDKICSNYMNNDVGLAFRKTWAQHTLTVRGEYKGRAVLLHGNDTSLLLRDPAYAVRLSDNSFVKNNFAQAHNIVTGEARFRSNNEEGFVYNVGLWADYIKDKMNSVLTGTPMSQTMLGIDGYFGYWFKTTSALYLDYDVRMFNKYNFSGISDGSYRFAPNFRFANSDWNVKVGIALDFLKESELALDTTLNVVRRPKDGKTKVYPDLFVSYKIDEDLATAYFRMDGKTNLNNYSAVALENPYILPGWCLDNSYDRFAITLGLRGSLNKKLNYNAFISYRMVDNMYFYVNSQIPVDTTASPLISTIRNNFTAYTDSTTACFTAGLDLGLMLRNFELNARVQYHGYGLDQVKKAWHKPAFELGLTGRYTYNQWIFSLGGYVRGAVPVVINKWNPLSSTISPDNYIETEIKTYFDLSFMAEYRWKNWISFFLQGSDLLNSRYQNYYLYYTQGITIGGGVTLKF